MTRPTMGIMRQNAIASLATKVVFVTLAVMGLGSMWIAIAADTGVSLLVVLNGMHLLTAEGVRREESKGSSS